MSNIQLREVTLVNYDSEHYIVQDGIVTSTTVQLDATYLGTLKAVNYGKSYEFTAHNGDQTISSNKEHIHNVILLQIRYLVKAKETAINCVIKFHKRHLTITLGLDATIEFLDKGAGKTGGIDLIYLKDRADINKMISDQVLAQLTKFNLIESPAQYRVSGTTGIGLPIYLLEEKA